MSRRIQESPSKRLIFALSISLSLASVLAIVPLWAGAAEPVKAVSAPVPTTPMDHSKMEAMKNMEGMSMTGDADYDFAVNMRIHHQMAVDMSQAQLKNGKSPKLRAMATKIIAAQKNEIAELDQWIKSTKKPIAMSK